MTKKTNPAQQSLCALIADDSYLVAFQTVAQYRAALLQYADGLAARQAAATGVLLAILRDVHDTLASESDSDIDHFEDDDEEREGAPVQYAARKVMEVIDMIKATAPSALSTPEAPVRRPVQRRAGPGGWE